MIETETSSTVAQPVANSHPKTEERRAVATAPAETAPPRNKKDDIPFPIVYFGFIAAFLLVNGGHMWSILPPLKEHMQTSFPPEARTVALPAFAFFVMCPLLYLWRGVVKGRLFSYIAKHWAGLKPKTMKHEKFCEQAWLAVHYSIATSFGYYVLRDKPWFPPAVSESAQHALLATRQEREADQKDLGLCALYAIQLGFYTLELVTLMTTKHRRSDATMYFFHHIFTLYLMAGSWVSYNHRIGSIVLFLHDVGDIFLPIGKCYTYAESHIRETQTRAQYNMHKNIGMFFFVMFVIAFAIPRLVVYGAVVYQGFTKYRWFSCCGFDASSGVCGECVGQENNSLYSTTLLSVLGLLYPMHVYWFYLIVKMAVRLVLFPGKYEDVRSDDEDVKTD